MRKATTALAAAGALGLLAAGGVTALAASDAGSARDGQLEAHSTQYFGVTSGLAASSARDISAAEAAANPPALATFATGLSARVVSSGQAAPNLDMGTLWPVSDPKWIISCNEQGTAAPGLQRISLADGHAETIVTGTSSCDPAHTTPWGTVVFGEEAGSSGGLYEILDPLAVTNATLDRTTGVSSVPAQIVRRTALGFLSYEGVGVLPSGVTYYGDELAPSSGAPGGAYYKFVPAHPYDGGAPITDLADSPLASGTVYGLQVGQGSSTGQGMNSGQGRWVALTGGQSLRPQAVSQKLTGFYRPEDLSIDEGALADGNVRWCGTNTGREEAHYFGETVCLTDGTPAQAATGASTPEVQQLVVGSPELNMPDNIAYQPGRGNWIVHEDAETTFERPHDNDLWSCLDDGGDADLQSDGCLRVATLNDLSAEWTGGFFDPTGTHFYVSVQHNKSGTGTLLDVTGWK